MSSKSSKRSSRSSRAPPIDLPPPKVPRKSSHRQKSQAQAPPHPPKKSDPDSIHSLFDRFEDPSFSQNLPRSIGPDGIEGLCSALGLHATDFRVLILAWKLQASRQGYFTLDEWQNGMERLNVSNKDSLRRVLDKLGHQVSKDPAIFRDVYAFAFKYCLTEPMQKTLELDVACQMLELMMRNGKHLRAFSSFLEFLKEQREYKGLNLDQWASFLRFAEEVKPDFENYDENEAWPVLLDNYVVWIQKNKEN